MCVDPKNTSLELDWGKRSSICIGTARGLQFLHEEVVPRIVHRDIKASNILLDRDFNPKIGDFGLAKLFPDDITHISTRIAGTTYVISQAFNLLLCVLHFDYSYLYNVGFLMLILHHTFIYKHHCLLCIKHTSIQLWRDYFSYCFS